jgi:hypothetical protein
MTADIIDLAGRRPQPEPEHEPLKPETPYEHIGVLAIGAADLAIEGRYLRAAAMPRRIWRSPRPTPGNPSEEGGASPRNRNDDASGRETAGDRLSPRSLHKPFPHEDF